MLVLLRYMVHVGFLEVAQCRDGPFMRKCVWIVRMTNTKHQQVKEGVRGQGPYLSLTGILHEIDRCWLNSTP